VRQDDADSSAEGSIVRNALLDELDELPVPRSLNRYCGAHGCRRRARPGGRHCSLCHAASVRRWRDAHAFELAVRRRDAAGARDDDARARDSARAKLAMALRRGKLTRGFCAVCGSKDAVALIPDPRRPFDVAWACRPHREIMWERCREDTERLTSSGRQAEMNVERARLLAAIADLEPVERASLHVQAQRGPAGIRVSAEAPLYTMNLIRAYKAQLDASRQERRRRER